MTAWPALTRLAAMGAPMLPRPMKPMVPWSEHLEYVVDGTFRRAAAGADGEDAVEPVVFRRGGFEGDRDAEIVFGRVDELAGCSPSP